eukprot:CAMPEP_0206440574 /NCGR_PEP_ID=MMETSP0324_2-20121206/12823_1 /ASSEMBLY_ACC=CAM_ASM_000836 /TAXON_ID=2866 /ORGANISM="Crypthecodinium cohnii, Strain Seligo" /LENGTH=290 /DNA_ID=CAMNT_0053908283 /DNA_START=113 /DNA_END=985 /DNA_ORIENTATION=-
MAATDASNNKYAGLIATEAGRFEADLEASEEAPMFAPKEYTVGRVGKVLAALAASAAVVGTACVYLRPASDAVTIGGDNLHSRMHNGLGDFVGLSAEQAHFLDEADAEQKATFSKLGGSLDHDKMRAMITEIVGKDKLEGPLPALEGSAELAKTQPMVNELLAMVEEKKKAWANIDQSSELAKPVAVKFPEASSYDKAVTDFMAVAEEQDQATKRMLQTEEGRSRVLSLLKELSTQEPKKSTDGEIHMEEVANADVEKLLEIARQHNGNDYLKAHHEDAWRATLEDIARN